MSGKKQQIGTLVDTELYRQIRALAYLEGRRAGDIIEDALRLYLETERSEIKMIRTKGFTTSKGRLKQ